MEVGALIRNAGGLPRWAALAVAIAVLVGGIVTVGARERRTASASRLTGRAPVASLTVHDESVSRRAGAGDFELAPSGTRLATGDHLRTDDAGFAQVDWFDGSLTRMDVATDLIIDELVAAGPRRVTIRMDVGRTWNRVEQLADTDSFEVETPVAVATVRGTIFVVACGSDGACTVIVFRGWVDVLPRGSGGTTPATAAAGPLRVESGEQVTIGPDGPGPVVAVDLAELVESDKWLRRNAELDQLEFARRLPGREAAASAGPTQAPAAPGIAGTAAPTQAPRATPTGPQPTEGPLRPMIAYTSDRGGQLDVWIGEADGSGARPLASHSAKDFGPAISPDGTRVAFTSERDGNQEIYVVGVDGSNLRRVTTDGRADSYPSWLPDSDGLVFQSNRTGTWQIHRVNPDGTGLVRLTSSASNERQATASSDGRIAFVSDRDGNDEIYSMQVDGSGLRRLTNSAATEGFPAWSPDASRIAYECTCIASKFEIFTMDPDGSNAMNITNSPTSDEYEPTWSPDGASIAYSSNASGNAEVYVAAADGSSPRNITNNPAVDHDPSWA